MPVPDPIAAFALDAPLRRVMRVYRRIYFDCAKAHGLTQTQAHALAHLSKEGPRRPGDLALMLEVTGGAATAVAASLMERGLLERRPDPADGRAALLALTEAGQALAKQLRGELSEQLNQGLGELPLASRHMILGGLEALAEALDASFPPACSEEPRCP